MIFTNLLRNFNKFIVFFIFLIVTKTAIAQEPKTEFEPIGDVTIKLDGEYYLGVLFSETERLRYIRLDIEYNSTVEKLENANKRIEEQKENYNKLLDTTSNSLKTIEKLAYKEKQTFFEKYDNVIFFGIGVVITVIAYSTYEAIK